MPDYSKGKIYTIRCLNDPNVYVGSTIQSLAVRMGGHRKDYGKNKVLGLHKEIVIDISEWKIELHELFPCLTKEELHRKEGEVIRKIGTLNKYIAGRTPHEWRIENTDKKKEYDKEYSLENVNKIKETKKAYYLKNADKIKEYKIENANKIKETNKQYHLKKKLEKAKKEETI